MKEIVIMRKYSLLILLLSLVAVLAQKSEPSCEEDHNEELLCSEEVIEAIKREEAGLPPVERKNKTLGLEEPPPNAGKKNDTAVDDEYEYYYDDEYYDEYYSDEYYSDEYYE